MDAKLFSSLGAPIRVALLNGQATTITSEPKSLPECFWGPAYAAGAVTGDMTKTSEVEKQEKARQAEVDERNAERKELIDFLQGVFEDPRSFVNKDGTPNTRKISAALGRAVLKPEVLEVWEVIVEAK